MTQHPFFTWIDLGLSFFYIFFPSLLAFFHTRYSVSTKQKISIFLLYYLTISVGIQGLLTGFFQIFYPSFIAESLQWPVSPFLIELGMANVAFGLLGLLSPRRDQGWRKATAVGYAAFLFMTGIFHIVRIVQYGFSPGDAGGFLLFDLIVSMILLILAVRG